MFKKNSKFQVTKDQLHQQSIFVNSMSLQPTTTTALKAGTIVIANQDFEKGYTAVEVVTDRGAYFHIPANELKPI